MTPNTKTRRARRAAANWAIRNKKKAQMVADLVITSAFIVMVILIAVFV